MLCETRERVVIVGTSRSGTTLLQSMLASHSSFFTIQELHFFDTVIPKKKYLRFKSWMSKKEVKRVKGIFCNIKKHNILDKIEDKCYYNKKKWAKILFLLMDEYAQSFGKKNWVEKTPLNLYYIDLYEKINPKIKIIHMVREPISNIASLIDASLNNSNYFKQDNVVKAVKRYKSDFFEHQKHINKQNHFFISYNNLVNNPRKVLIELCEFLNIEFEEDMIYNFSNSATSIIHKDEVWKSKNTESKLVKSKKWKDVLHENDIKYIENKLSNINIERLFIKNLN